MRQILKFKSSENLDFSNILKERVHNYFKHGNISIHSNASMWFRSIGLIAIWVMTYLLLICLDWPIWFMYVLWSVLGMSMALVAINVGHDAIHGAYSSKKWVNDLLSHTFNFNGASAYMWKRMHNMAHHTYTNIPGYDEDLDIPSIIRVSPDSKLKTIHKYQQFYSFLLYSLSVLSWIFVKDYVKFFKNTVGNPTGKSHARKEYFFLFFYKGIAYGLFIVIPIVFVGAPLVHVLLGISLMYLLAGLYLSLVFMLAHAVEETTFPVPKQGTIENQWLVHQLETTSNFSSTSNLVAFLTGGLNQQIEHHLFPNICSVHYPALSSIVKNTAIEYGIPYRELGGFWTALSSHYSFLKRMGAVTGSTSSF